MRAFISMQVWLLVATTSRKAHSSQLELAVHASEHAWYPTLSVVEIVS